MYQHGVPGFKLAPGVCLGLFDAIAGSDFKVVVNCGSTLRFLQFLEERNPAISLNVIVLNLDPDVDRDDAAYQEFHRRFNRVLQNYLTFFYEYNDCAHYYVNSNYQSARLVFELPTMNGVLLRLLFNINRLLRLIRNMNSATTVLLVAEHFGEVHHSNSVLYALAISYLMDCYGYNFDASYGYVRHLVQHHHDLFGNSYTDVLLVDNLKKFFVENSKIKQAEAGVLTTNRQLKRSMDTLEMPRMKRTHNVY